jgi:hypothetical protein
MLPVNMTREPLHEDHRIHTVVARFHHRDRDLGEIERELVEAGAQDACVTGYTIAVTIASDSHADASETTRHLLDKIGATHIKITKRGKKRIKDATAS